MVKLKAKSRSHQEDFDSDYEEDFDEEEGKREGVDRGGPSLIQAMERETGLGIFLSHLREAGLTEILGGDDEGDKSARGFTLFAPTDRAWAKASLFLVRSKRSG